MSRVGLTICAPRLDGPQRRSLDAREDDLMTICWPLAAASFDDFLVALRDAVRAHPHWTATDHGPALLSMEANGRYGCAP